MSVLRTLIVLLIPRKCHDLLIVDYSMRWSVYVSVENGKVHARNIMYSSDWVCMSMRLDGLMGGSTLVLMRSSWVGKPVCCPLFFQLEV